MARKIASTYSSVSRKKTVRTVLLAFVLVVVVIALVGAMTIFNRSTENRGRAVGFLKYPTTIAATSPQASGATSPTLAIDGNRNTFWNGGGSPRKWVSVDIGLVGTISQVKLTTNQFPAGATTHKVYVSNTPPTDANLGTLVQTFSGSTSDNQVLERTFSPTIAGRYVTVETTASPSWVAWREIEVYRPEADVLPPPPSPAMGERKYGSTIQATVTQAPGATSPTLAVDGNTNTFWNSFGLPNKWISLNLGQTGPLTRIKLVTTQAPAGVTTHKIYVSATPPTQGSYGTLVHTFTGNTTDGQTLEKVFSPQIENVRYVTVETTASPSWVAWREIEAYGPSATVLASPPPATSPGKPGYTLAFNDEFDCAMTDNVSSACKTNFYNKWFTRYVYGGGTTDRLNPQLELQQMKDNGNHVVSNGTLKLIAKKIRPFDYTQCGNYRAGTTSWKYTPYNCPVTYESGMIRSRFAFQRDHYVEARMKLPRQQATFGAFWLAGNDSQWPPELEIAEYWNIRQDPVTWVYQSLKITNNNLTQIPGQVLYRHPAITSSPTEPNSGYFSFGSPSTADLSRDFHIYGLDWQGDTLTWYIDGVMTQQIRGPYWAHRDGSDAGPAQAIISQSMIPPYNEFEQYPGAPADSAMPAQVQTEVDYVRVYTKD